MVATEELDPSDPTPLWAQLTALLRRRLGAGDYFSRFPTEMELTVEFEVSRATVREAIRRLKDEGLLDARRGSGTFVVRRKLDQGLIGAPSLAQTILDAGLEEQSTVLRFGEDEVGDEVAASALGLEVSAPVVWVERARNASGRPLALDRSALSMDEEQRKAFLSADLGRGSIYDVLAEMCHIQVTGATEQVRAVTVTPDENELLCLEPGEGVLEVERITFADQSPVEWRRSLLRGDTYVLSASWGVTPSPDGARD